MEKEGRHKKQILFLLGIISIVGFLVFIFGASLMSNTVVGGNYSTSIPFNCSLNSSEMVILSNVSIYYNASGGVAGIFLLKNASTDGKGNYTNWTVDGSINYSISALNFSPVGFLTGGLRTYNFSCKFCNSTGACWYEGSRHNVTIDFTAPSVTFINIKNYSTDNFVDMNVSVNDTTTGLLLSSVFFNISNSTGGQLNLTLIANLTNNVGGGMYNYSVNLSGFPEGKYNLTVKANDTLNNVNSTTFSFAIDRTPPTASYTCSVSSVQRFGTIACTCTPSDSLVGINSSATVAESVDVSTAGIHTLTCTYKDLSGNSGSTQVSYTVTSSDSSSTSTSQTTTTTPEKINTWTKVVVGIPVVMQDFSSQSSISQIEIEVSSEANNVQLTVNEYSSKPSGVSVSQADSYKYLKIDTLNLVDKLSKAIVQIKVEKSWVSQKGIDKEKVGLFRFNEGTQRWNELTTVFSSEDATYYYYNVELTGFSYFVIAPKATVTTTGGDKTTPSEKESTSFAWGWIIAVLIILGILAVLFVILGKKKKRK